MIRSVLGPLLRIGASLLDRSLSEADVEAYLQQSSSKLSVEDPITASLADELTGQLHLTLNLLSELGFSSARSGSPAPARGDLLPDPAQALAWLCGLGDRVPIKRAGVEPGTLVMLSALLEDQGAMRDERLAELLERILRHAELRREHAFEPIGGRVGGGPWSEKHRAAILLARAASLLGDIRFLNAALKLNDRAYAHHRRFRLDERHVLYLRALTEQELALRKAVP